METTPIGCRVLVVDDDPIVRRAVTILFARFGYPVASAEGGREAIARIENTPYGLVVSDFDMPQLDGYRLACRIKHAHNRTKVVLMTGGGLPQAAAYAGCREIDGWLFKPFDLQAISRMMKALELPNAFAAVRSAQHSHAAEARRGPIYSGTALSAPPPGL